MIAPRSRYGSRPAIVVVEPVGGLGAWCAERHLERVLLVTDEGVAQAGHAERVCAGIRAAGLEVRIYDRAEIDPRESSVVACGEVARAWRADCLVAVGGGSCIDTAKGCALWLARGGPLHAWHGYDPEAAAMLPLVAVPTTAGTGSEVQSFALLSRDDDHGKFAVGAPGLMPVLAWLDASLCVSVPQEVARHAGLDALAHALETAVTSVATQGSRRRSMDAAAKLWHAFPRVCANPRDQEAAAEMLLGATMAGQAIEASMLGAAHALANPLTAQHGVPHGLAVGCMLPHVVRFNAQDRATDWHYHRLASVLGLSGGGTAIADALESLLSRESLGLSLVREDVDIESLAEAALTQWTGTFNPRPLTLDAARALYVAALESRP